MVDHLDDLTREHPYAVDAEPLADRLRNPGLEAHLGQRVVAGSCVLVAVMRALQLTTVSVTA